VLFKKNNKQNEFSLTASNRSNHFLIQ